MIGQIMHGRPNNIYNNRAAVLNQFLHAKLAAKEFNYVNVGQSDVWWCHKVTELKGGLLMWHFRSNVFCGRAELLLVRTLTFLTLKIFYMHKAWYKTLKGRKNNVVTMYKSSHLNY